MEHDAYSAVAETQTWKAFDYVYSGPASCDTLEQAVTHFEVVLRRAAVAPVRCGSSRAVALYVFWVLAVRRGGGRRTLMRKKQKRCFLFFLALFAKRHVFFFVFPSTFLRCAPLLMSS